MARPTKAGIPGASSAGSSTADIDAARRDLVLASLSFAVSGAGFGLVYGLAAREAGFSVIEATAMSVFVLAGVAQFAAVGLIADGAGWPSIVFLTALLNARHLLYSAAMAPWLGGRSRLERAAMAHVLTDETFALSLAHFQRLRRADVAGFWLAAGFDSLSWPIFTALGVIGGQLIPDPADLGLSGICVLSGRVSWPRLQPVTRPSQRMPAATTRSIWASSGSPWRWPSF